MSIRVLWIDDDARLRALVSTFLARHGIACESVGSAADGLRVLERTSFDLVLLDLGLPDEDGLALCQQLRRRWPMTPIIILSARGTDVDRIVGLEVGADDYLGKPCNLRELVTRIFTVLRRCKRGSAAGERANVVRFGPYELDLWSRLLKRDGAPVRTTPGELQLLEVLARNSRRVLNRDELLNLAFGRRNAALSRSVDILISRLRRALEPDPANPRYIQTIWGRGYMFVPDGARE